MNRDKILNEMAGGPLRRSAPSALTTTSIAALKPGCSLADGAIRPGSGSLKIRKRETARGLVTEWLFEWTRDGKTVRQSLGRFGLKEVAGSLTLAQARAVAFGLQETVRSGESPLHKRNMERVAAQANEAVVASKMRDAGERTLSALLSTYISSLEKRGKKDSAYDAANMFANHVEQPFAEVAKLPAVQITPEHIAQILARLVGPDVKKKKGRTALKLRSYMGAAFQVALGASIDPMAPAGAAGFGLTGNPAAAVPATRMASTFNRPGERTLSEDELRAFLAHLEAWPSVLQRLALKLQLATAGQRIQQLLRLRHADVSNGMITLRDSKGRRSVPRLHVVPIVAEMQEIIDELRKINPITEDQPDGFLFASRGTRLSPTTLSSVVQDICKVMLGWDAHSAVLPQSTAAFRGGDIRRTVETMMAGTLRTSKDTRAQLLSHGLTGVQDVVYDKALHLDAKRTALRDWNDFLAGICIGAPV